MAFNMDPKKCPMPTQDPNVRNKNFKEVALGYTEDQAVDEANRCLHCPKKPCQSGCPVSINIPEFIAKIKERDFEGAYQVIHQSSSLPAVCGRVCPQETQCESKCVRGIKGEPVGIGRLERFVADWNRENADEMKIMADALDASPILIGETSSSGKLEKGIIYTRFKIPIISNETLADQILEEVPPFIFAAPGGLYVKIDSDTLRQIR